MMHNHRLERAIRLPASKQISRRRRDGCRDSETARKEECCSIYSGKMFIPEIHPINRDDSAPRKNFSALSKHLEMTSNLT